MFKTLKIKVSEKIGLDYSGWNGHREIELKPGVDVTSFLNVDTPIRYLSRSKIQTLLPRYYL